MAQIRNCHINWMTKKNRKPMSDSAFEVETGRGHGFSTLKISKRRLLSPFLVECVWLFAGAMGGTGASENCICDKARRWMETRTVSSIMNPNRVHGQKQRGMRDTKTQAQCNGGAFSNCKARRGGGRKRGRHSTGQTRE